MCCSISITAAWLCRIALAAHPTGDAVERAYARSDVFDKRRKMMGAWAAFLAEKRDNVVRIG